MYQILNMHQGSASEYASDSEYSSILSIPGLRRVLNMPE